MANIEFDDPSMNKKKVKNKYLKLFVITILTSLVLGAVGGVGGILLLSSTSGVNLAKKLGISDSGLTIPTVRTEKLILEESNAVIDTVDKVSSAVVSIQQKKTVQDIFGQVYQSSGGGTGFIITSDGLILTNKHVVTDQNAEYSVTTSDGNTYTAKVKSLDPLQDIAVIQIEARNLPVVEFGDSDALKVGQWVVAVGNALGMYENSVTVGVVSGRNRKIEATDANGNNSESMDGLIQTDAAINPGNSGGPLVNLKGQVIGINTAVASNAQSIGFAIPINEAKSAIESIKSTGRIIRPYLGVRYVQLNKDLATQNKFPVDYGALIIKGSGLTDVAVIPGSPADKAGIVENDIVLEINGEKIDQNNGLLRLIQQYKVGDEIELKVYSKGAEKTVKVKLEEGK